MREPSIKETAFSCPHCGAYTTQHWYNAFVKYIGEDRKIPLLPDKGLEERVCKYPGGEKENQWIIEWASKMRLKTLFTAEKDNNVYVLALNNLFLSNCYNCRKWAIWVNEDLIYPPKKILFTSKSGFTTRRFSSC